MSRITPISPDKASADLKEMYDAIKKKMGVVPNIFQTMGNSPAVLNGYLGLAQAASQTSLAPKVREQIALVVGQTNQCNYCLAAHNMIGGNLGLHEDERLHARKGNSSDAKIQAILTFAKLIVDKRGQVSDEDVKNLKAANVSDEEISEIVLVITENIFTNYFNLVTDPTIDFPHAPELK